MIEIEVIILNLILNYNCNNCNSNYVLQIIFIMNCNSNYGFQF